MNRKTEANENTLKELVLLMKDFGYEVIMTSEKDIPAVSSISEDKRPETCALCGDKIRHVLTFPKAKKGNSSTRPLTVCPDLTKCLDRIDARRRDRAQRLEALAKSVKFPGVIR